MCYLLLLVLAADPAAEAKKDLEKLQGEWVMTALEVDGKPVPDAKLQGTTLTIKGSGADLYDRHDGQTFVVQEPG